MEKTCLRCSTLFSVSDADLAFYERIAPTFDSEAAHLPAPRLCPDCRCRRRLTFRNERKLYQRSCSRSGEKLISIFSPDKPHTVYSNKLWWSAEWSPLDYGREIDFSRPFFDQFKDLYETVPKQALIGSGNENCDFVNYVVNCKDCYLVLGWGENSEHCLYGKLLVNCRDCMDVTHANDCELCMHCVSIVGCYRLFYSQSCKHCHDAYYLRNCIGCSDCFGCINLNNKQYCLFNEQLSKDEYNARLRFLLADLRSGAQAAASITRRIDDLYRLSPHKYYQGINTQDCSGDYLVNCKNIQAGFDVRDSEDGRYLTDINEVKACMDLSYAGKNNTEYSYECVNYTSTHCMFSSLIWFCHDLFYCQDCFNGVHDCFGCTGLTHAEYCILNKSYSREEYGKLCRKLVSHMRETGEWGEFFPSALSPFGYNETLAQEDFPLSRNEALRQGFNWSDYNRNPQVKRLVKGSDLPRDPAHYSDEILEWTIECEATKRPFKIAKEELKFCREQRLALSHLHPDERHRLRNALRNPRKLWTRRCAGCQTELQSTYGPERPEAIYCERCFLGKIY